MTVIAFDTETTGLDFRHGARPYFVTIAGDFGVRYWEWPVDPLTRMPSIPPEDIVEIRAALSAANTWVGHNIKFDLHALESVGVASQWPFGRIHDTTFSAHLLASNQPKNLTDQTTQWLHQNIQPLEDDLKDAVLACRRRVQQARLARKRRNPKPPPEDALADWMIAEDGLRDAFGNELMPSSGGASRSEDKLWKADCWLPSAIAEYDKLPANHPWRNVLALYANADSITTIALFKAHQREIERRGLAAYYKASLAILPVLWEMERGGGTVSRERTGELISRFGAESVALGDRCREIAAGFTDPSTGEPFALELPAGATPNQSLRSFMFDVLDLERIRAPKAKTDAPTLNAEAMAHYRATLEEGTPARGFIEALLDKRKRDSALTYLDAYRRFWLPEGGADPDAMVLRCSINATGTDTLRMSSYNPNESNVSKRDDFNLRYGFGPAKGREWWSIDYKNLERRIPAYRVGETEIIALFERPDDPPYYGSEHALVAAIIYPDEFAKLNGDGRLIKDKNFFSPDKYRRVKGFNFGTQYGMGARKANRLVGVGDAFERVQARFVRQRDAVAEAIRFASRHGYIETFPDKSVDPARGYPLLVSRTERGEAEPTKPWNYKVQGTACWEIRRAMVRIAPQLKRWSAREGKSYRLIFYVHDELVFDFPAGRGHEPWRTNYDKIKTIAEIMESGGADIGVPTPTNVEYHPRHWAEGIAVN